MRILIRNQKIKVLPDGKEMSCTLRNAHRFAGYELESVRIEDDQYAPYSNEFGHVCAFLKSRVRNLKSETPNLCPFCKAKNATVTHDITVWGEGSFVECINCMARGPINFEGNEKDGEQKTIIDWNKYGTPESEEG